MNRLVWIIPTCLFAASEAFLASHGSIFPQIRRERLPFSLFGMIDLDDSNYSHLLRSDEPVLVDVMAKWCGPCKLIHPTLERVASEWSGRLHVARFDVEEGNHNGAFKTELLLQGAMLTSLPMLILFKGQEVVATHKGIITQDALNDLLSKHLEEDTQLGTDLDTAVSTQVSPSGRISFSVLQVVDDYVLSSE